MRRGCLLLLILLVSIPSTGAVAEPVADALRRIQQEQNLEMPVSTVLEDRQYQSRIAQESLRDYIRARQAMLQNEPIAAMGLLTSAISLDPSNEAAWRELAILRERRQQYRQAHQAWQRVILIDPDDIQALQSLGITSSLEGDMGETARRLMAWRLNDGHRAFDARRPFQGVLAEAALAESLEVLSEAEVAAAIRQSVHDDIRAMAQGSKPYRPDVDTWLQFVRAIHQHRAHESAFDALSFGLQAPWVQPQARFRMLILAIGIATLFDDGQHISGLFHDLADRGLLDFQPTEPGTTPLSEALFETARIFNQMGNSEGAAWLYEDVVEEDPTDVMALNNLAYYLLEQGRIDSAVERMIATAWEAAPTDSAVLDSYGWLRYLQGEFEDDEDGPGALSLLTASHVQAGEYPSPEVLDHLGDVQYRLGDVDGAKESWFIASAILTDPEARAQAIGRVDQLQESLWGWWGGRLKDSGALYDLEVGPLKRRLKEKLAALAAGKRPVVRETASEAAAAAGENENR